MEIKNFLIICILSSLFICCYGDGTGTEKTCENTFGLDVKTDLILTTQKQVDLASNKTHIKGNLYVGSCPDLQSSRITNLRGLKNLTKIDGNLMILETDIAIIEDLDKLQEIGGGLSISQNNSLTEIKNLNALKSVNSLNIFGNPNLISISGFTALENCQLTLAINANENLETVEGFNKLTHIGEDLSIESNSNLGKLEGFENLTVVEKNVLLNSNVLIKKIEAFNNLKNIGENLDLRYNWDLTILDNFQKLDTIKRSLVIDNHKELTSITGLNNLTFIGHQLYIADNNKLSDYCGLTNLIQTEGGLQEGNSLPPYPVPYFQIINNLYNPSRQDLMENNCSL